MGSGSDNQVVTAAVSILLVEDDPDDIYLTTRALRQCGIEMIEAVNDAVSAIDRLTSHGTPDSRYDLLITDLSLPGTSGVELITRLNGMLAPDPIPVIVLTSSTDPHHHTTCEKLGVVSFLTKPPPLELLGRAIRHAVGLRRSRCR